MEGMTERWDGGNPVHLYRQLEDSGEADIVHAAVLSEAAILELGCGTGRMTRRLMQLGHHVTAVDSSEEMLLHVPSQARKIHTAIEDLSLGEQFSVVLLASNLVNTTNAEHRQRLLTACRHHVSPEGAVVIQRYEPRLSGWANTEWYTRGNVEIRVQDFVHSGEMFSARVEYRVGSDWFAQSFSAQILDDASLATNLAAAGLQWGRTLDAERSWVLALPGNGS
jgi:SAM-dependent methyltransferase